MQTPSTDTQRSLHVSADPEQLALHAAECIIRRGREAIQARGRFRLALAGGSTPRKTYRALAAEPCRGQLDWDRVEWFFGDERDVPAGHADSNARMARETLLDALPVAERNIHPMRHDGASLRRDAARYGALLRRRLPAAADGWPVLDLVLLGLGADGHTASLFPGTCILHERQLSVAAVYVPQHSGWRLSLTLPTLEHARGLMFLVSGRDKAAALAAALQPSPGSPLPVNLLHPTGTVSWWCDRDAAAALPQGGDLQ